MTTISSGPRSSISLPDRTMPARATIPRNAAMIIRAFIWILLLAVWRKTRKGLRGLSAGLGAPPNIGDLGCRRRGGGLGGGGGARCPRLQFPFRRRDVDGFARPREPGLDVPGPGAKKREERPALDRRRDELRPQEQEHDAPYRPLDQNDCLDHRACSP